MYESTANDILVGEQIVKIGHRARVIRVADKGRGAVFGNLEQYPISMMPGMAAGVVGRCGQEAIFVALAPVRLPFKVHAVTCSAIFSVDQLALGDEPGVVRLENNLVTGYFDITVTTSIKLVSYCASKQDYE